MQAFASISTDIDSYGAGRKAVSGLKYDTNSNLLLIIFTTDNYIMDQVIAGVKNIAKDAYIVGFCCGGIITGSGVIKQGVGILALNGDFKAKTTLVKKLDENPYSTGEQAGRELLSSGIKDGTVIVMPDGFQSNVSEMLRGLYNAMGPGFQYTGGGAGDNLKFFKTYQFTEKECSENALAAALVSGIDWGISIGHGWLPTGEPLVITEADGKCVYEIDGIAAFTEYSNRLGNISKDDFPSKAMLHPLGFPDISNHYIIRDPLKVNSDNSIFFVTEIPTQAVGYIMDCNIESLVNTAYKTAGKAAEIINRPSFVLLFDCISRYLLMGNNFQKEINMIKQVFKDDVPILGALTFGEIGSYARVPLFHNKTTIIAAGGNA